MIWVQLAWFVASTLISIALAPKPPKPKAAALGDFQLPTVDEDRPIPVIFGTVRQTGPNVTWYGNLGKRPIKKSSGFSKTTVGYKYDLGVQFVSCLGPVDALTRIEVGEKLAWSGSLTANGNIAISNGGLFGGEKGEGGLIGTLEVRFGANTQNPCAYLESIIGSAQTADRGVQSAVWHNAAGDGGGYIGNTSYPKPWAFTYRRITKGWLNDDPWYTAKASIGTSMNAVHIVYQTFTDPEWGMGVPASLLDNTVWQAAADVAFDEGFGLDLILNGQMAAEDFMEIVLDTLGGGLRLNHSTGLVEIVLARGDYDADDLELFDEDSILVMRRYQRQAWGETINEVQLIYTDAVTRKPTSIAAQSLGNINAQEGQLISEKIEYIGISDPDLAQRVVLRELKGRSTPLAQASFEVNRAFWSKTPGDVFKLTWLAEDLIEVPFRVINAEQSELDRNVIVVESVQDIFGLPANGIAGTPSAGIDQGDPPEPVDDETELGGSIISSTTTAPPGSPADGDTYYVPTAATGAWATHIGEVATWNDDEGSWLYQLISSALVVFDITLGSHITLEGDGTTGPAPWASPIQWQEAGVDVGALGGITTVNVTGDASVTESPTGTITIDVTGGGGGGGSSGSGLDVQVFTASGTWTKPSNAVSVSAYVIGAGGGGASGRVGAASSLRMGGGGGGGGGLSFVALAAGSVGCTETVTVGAGGTAGAGQTTDSSNGNAGGTGGASSFGAHASANGGAGGEEGTNSSSTGDGGAGGTGSVGNGGAGGNASGSGGQTAGASATWGGGGGAGGSGISSGNVIGDDTLGGGTGGTATIFPAAGGAAITNTAAQNGAAGSNSAGYFGGGGGGAGTASGSANGGTGAVGGRGGGGGGGTGALNGFDGGAGGVGGGGMVVVVTTIEGAGYIDQQILAQAADMVHTSDTTYNDSDLTFSVPAAGTYIYEGNIHITNATTPDTKVKHNFTGTTSLVRMTGLVGLGSSAFMNTQGLNVDIVFTSAGLHTYEWKGVIVATAPGTLSVQCAQNASSGTSVTAPHSGSYAKLTRLS